MGETTDLLSTNLKRVKPESGTHNMELKMLQHKLRKLPGDHAWATAIRGEIEAVRTGRIPGDSRILKSIYCVPCGKRSVKVLLLHSRERVWCGSCGWLRPEFKACSK